jgi:hypothetical protein
MRPLNYRFAKLKVLACFLTALPMAYRAEAEPARTFPSAEAAAVALVDAVRSNDAVAAVITILGDDGAGIVASGDAVADAARRERFSAAFEEAHKIEAEADKSVLYVGKDEVPFPIPLRESNGAWYWDAAAGLEEILTRRIGENELSTIEVMRAFVAAQQEYASSERDGAGIQYARRLMSREGRKDGLYWPAAGDDEQSPMGPLIAAAQREGYRPGSRDDGRQSYHGYIYRMLYGQGSNASGGPRDYIVNDRMIGGFALIATPAAYGNSGVMTFIVNQDGDVYERDLGPDTEQVAARIKLFDPDGEWRKVDQ